MRTAIVIEELPLRFSIQVLRRPHRRRVQRAQPFSNAIAKAVDRKILEMHRPADAGNSGKVPAHVRVGLDTGTHEWEGAHGHPEDAEEPADVVEAVVLQRTSQ